MTRAIALTLLSLAVLAASLFLFPVDSDGAFAAFDGIVYGTRAERGEPEPANAFHPLFHAIAGGLTAALRAQGVPHPGHVAIRIVSGLGAVATFLLIACAAGKRWLAGLGFAAALLVTRVCVMDAAVGETILPGCAAALWAVLEATRAPVRTLRMWLAVLVALLLRADNVLLLPGILAVLFLRKDASAGGRKIALGLLATGAATVLGYALFWWSETKGRPPLWEYLSPSNLRRWMNPRGLEASGFLAHVDASSVAVVGRTWAPDHLNLWIGPSFVGALLVAGMLLRGSSRVGALLCAIVPTIAIRTAFFSWFDAANPEWPVLTMAFVALVGARLAEGEPRFPAGVGYAGAGLLLATIALVLFAHGPYTRGLRRRHFIEGMEHAVSEGRGCRVIALGPNVHNALDFLGVGHVLLPVSAGSAEALPAVMAELGAHPEPTLIVFERWTPWMVAGVPYLVSHAPTHRVPLDDMAPTPELRVIRWDGYAFALRYEPPLPK